MHVAQAQEERSFTYLKHVSPWAMLHHDLWPWQWQHPVPAVVHI